MLKKINSEARVLLQMTKDQKRRFEDGSTLAKCAEQSRVLRYINMASRADKFEKKDFDRCGIQTEEDIRFFELVKGEVDLLKKKLNEETANEIKITKNECDSLREKMTHVLLDNRRTKIANKSLANELEELKLQQKSGLQRLKQERDVYKSQVEDLEAIREAYAQLVDKQPNTSQMEREFIQQIDERDNRILDLEKLVTAQIDEIEGLKTTVAEQNDRITVLNRFINLTRPNTPRFEQATDDTRINLDPCSSKSKFEKKFDNRSESNICRKLSKLPSEERKLRKSDPVFPRYRRCGIGTKTYAKGSIKKNPAYKRKLPPMHSSQYSQIKKLINNSFESLCQSDRNSSSCINIFSPKSRISGDIREKVVTTSEATKGKVKMEKSSHFSLEIKYKNSDIDNALFELDEYEIFKDVSRESVVLENKYSKMSRFFR